MDDFNNFFDDPNDYEPKEKTHIYHTPEPPKKNNNKHATLLGISIIMSVVMCLVVIINVVVLAALKNQIAAEYSKSLSQVASDEYYSAINDVLKDADIVDDVTNEAAQKAADNLKSGVGKIANNACASVARITMSSSTDPNASGLATAFLITDSTTSSQERYLVTNAHCCRYVKATLNQNKDPYHPTFYYSLQWQGYDNIVCVFENDTNQYTAEVVAYGSYKDSTYETYKKNNYNVFNDPGIENDQPDLAVLRIVGTQPDNTAHPSLKIASKANSANRGDSVAIIGNPQGEGTTNSIAIGTISQTGIVKSTWGAGTFTMTDAAINGGNSGGPMINENGLVVGVVESKLVSSSIENMGFALDSSTLIDFISWAKTQYSLTINYTQG